MDQINFWGTYKSDNNLNVPVYFGIMKIGVACTELLHLCSTPILHNLSSSFLRVSSWIFATVKG